MFYVCLAMLWIFQIEHSSMRMSDMPISQLMSDALVVWADCLVEAIGTSATTAEANHTRSKRTIAPCPHASKQTWTKMIK